LSRLRLTIDSDLKDVYLIALSVSRICEYLQMDSLEAYRMELCAVEAVTNSIRHAYGNRTGAEVSVTVSVRDNKLELEVADTGLAMLAAQVDRLSRGSDVFGFDAQDRTSLPVGGMGLQIMHEAMDEVSYQTDGNTNRLRLAKKLSGSGAGSPSLSSDKDTFARE
jgi:serine/threonine-protein kinase RsbW